MWFQSSLGVLQFIWGPLTICPHLAYSLRSRTRFSIAHYFGRFLCPSYAQEAFVYLRSIPLLFWVLGEGNLILPQYVNFSPGVCTYALGDLSIQGNKAKVKSHFSHNLPRRALSGVAGVKMVHYFHSWKPREMRVRVMPKAQYLLGTPRWWRLASPRAFGGYLKDLSPTFGAFWRFRSPGNRVASFVPPASPSAMSHSRSIASPLIAPVKSHFSHNLPRRALSGVAGVKMVHYSLCSYPSFHHYKWHSPVK